MRYVKKRRVALSDQYAQDFLVSPYKAIRFRVIGQGRSQVTRLRRIPDRLATNDDQ